MSLNRLDITSIHDLSLIRESHDLECKKALGKNHRGEIPKSLWESYSAFANTDGGYLILGVEERKEEFVALGIPDSERLIKELYTTLNNRQKISFNTVSNHDIKTIDTDNGQIIVMHVPAATRKQKPVYLNNNPLSKTYIRLHDGDRLCDEETVKRMLAEQQYDARDSLFFPGYTMQDIEEESLLRFRNMLFNKKTGHPFLELNNLEFLKKIGGYKRDRDSGKEGLTLAGILMFGKWEAIQEAVPNYFVDYQERPEPKAELRWIDRVVPDGTWSGNVFDFYRLVYDKMTTGLKIPFQLKSDQRIENGPIHEAIREALINALVHADYSARVPVLVVKRPDMFGFRNPGLMRIPVKDAYSGGISDCRNRIMHQMFLLVGLGERAGSGLPKILQNWNKQHWRKPYLYERKDPEQTLMELRMQSLIPEETLSELRNLFGSRFDQLTKFERVILATAETEGVITHQRIQSFSEKHPHDISLLLQKLVKDGFLTPTGKTRGKTYALPGRLLPTPEDIFTKAAIPSEQSSEHNAKSSEHNVKSSEHNRDKNGRLITSEFSYPVVDKIDSITPYYRNKLLKICALPRNKRRIDTNTMNEILLLLCTNQYITLNVLANLVDRHPNSLRQRYIKTLVDQGDLRLAFPSTPNHQKQAYITNRYDQ
jgi:predicted HTH transcriptional regulator